MENRLEDLRAVLDATNPGLLGSAATFRDRFAVPIEKLGHAEPAERLALVTRPFVLRRVKTDPAVAGDLPEKIEMTVRANLTPDRRRCTGAPSTTSPNDCRTRTPTPVACPGAG